MHIAYFDESGDDGYPKFSSPLFVLTGLYMHYLHWKASFEAVRELRRSLCDTYGLPVKVELHTKYFLLNKRSYRDYQIADKDRATIIGLFCDLVARLDLRIVSVAIVKPRISSPKYQVLQTALKYSVQRIENDLNPDANPDRRFMLITDSGRVAKMRQTTRLIQRMNYIPSNFGPQPYRQEIQSMIEDPLPKDSRESYFIQLADLIAYVVYLLAVHETGVAAWPSRLPSTVTAALVDEWMNRMLPSLNTQASGKHPYGIVYHPS